MSIYSKALRHIDMKDVKKKHQQKLIEQKIQKKLEREEKKYIQSVMETVKYDWRKEIQVVENQVEEVVEDLIDKEYDWREQLEKNKKKYFEEGMTSAGTFFTTLPATGEVDLQVIDGANQSSFDPTYTTGIEFGSSGNGSGRMGGFNIGQNYVKFSQTPNASNDRTVDTIKVDTSTYTTITVNAIAGNNSNGGVSPTANLFVYWFSDTNAGLLGTIPSSGTSLTQYSFTLPAEARGKNIDIYFYEPDVPLQRTQYIGQSIPSLHPSTWNDTIAGYANNILMKANPTSDDFDVWGGAAWIAMQQQYYGATSAYTWNYPGYPAPVSGSTTGTTGADRIAVGQAIYNAFGTGSSTRYPLTYGIKSIGYQRRTPVNVFVSLDSPEATAFIRSDPNLSDLSPKEKQQKLKEMLEASDEYVMKIFGGEFPGTGAVPPGESGDIPGVEIDNWIASHDKPFSKYPPAGGSDNWPGLPPDKLDLLNTPPNPTKPGDAPILPFGLPQAQGNDDNKVAWNIPVLPTGPSTPVRNYGTKDKPLYMPYGPSGFPGNYPPGYIPTASNDKKQPVLASYELQGEVITEKRKLKSPEEVLNKIPGYYDGKPAPLGFPVEQPPKMVNGMHPDLVDGKKISDRFNRLDPESAKATPLTGNPHIDKKIKAARKQPK